MGNVVGLVIDHRAHDRASVRGAENGTDGKCSVELGQGLHC